MTWCRLSRFVPSPTVHYAVVRAWKRRQSSFLRHDADMSDCDPNELLLICDSIIEDGELTYAELYQLAEWLNRHQEACLHRPGNLLVELLRKAWADGKTTKTEARQLARLLIEFASQTARTFDLSRPKLPAIPFSTRIRSHTTRGVFYEVDLGVPTCTCPDFSSIRHRLPTGHLTRCCKHIFGAYAQLEPSEGWPGWLRSFLGLAWAPHPKQEWDVLSIRQGGLVCTSLQHLCSFPRRRTVGRMFSLPTMAITIVMATTSLRIAGPTTWNRRTARSGGRCRVHQEISVSTQHRSRGPMRGQRAIVD